MTDIDLQDVSFMLTDTVCHATTDMMLSLRVEPSPEIVNVVHPHPVSWNFIFEGIRDALHDHIPLVPFHDWLSKIEAKAVNATANDLNDIVSPSHAIKRHR